MEIAAGTSSTPYEHDEYIPTQVRLSINSSGQPAHTGGKSQDRKNALIAWAEEKEEWMADQAAEEACNKFLIDCIG